MSFPLPPEFERAVLDRVRSGRYASPDDVLRALVDALGEQEALLRDIQEGLDSVARDEVVTDDEAGELFQILEADEEDFDAAFQAMRQRCGIPLGSDYRQFVDDEVRSGRYASPREVLEASLSLLRRAKGSNDDDEALSELRREIDLGFESGDRGELISGEEVEARIRVRMCTPEVREFVERKVSAGEYGSVSEIVAAGLKLLMEEDEDLRHEIERSRGRPTIPGDVAFARLRESRKAAGS